jgi:hypothetical protein
MANDLTTRLLFAAALVVAFAAPAQAASNLYGFAHNAYLFSFYDHVCKPGSLSPKAKKAIELVAENLQSDLTTRVINDIAAEAKRYGPIYCTQLEHDGDVKGFNASAERPDVEQIIKTKIAKAKLDDAEQSKPYFSAELPGNGSRRFILSDSKVAPDWRTMTVNECVVTIDTELAKRDQELSEYEMFIAYDSLTKGFARQTITRPRRGTEAGARVNECMQRYYARTPISHQQPEKFVELACQRPANNVRY